MNALVRFVAFDILLFFDCECLNDFIKFGPGPFVGAWTVAHCFKIGDVLFTVSCDQSLTVSDQVPGQEQIAFHTLSVTVFRGEPKTIELTDVEIMTGMIDTSATTNATAFRVAISNPSVEDRL